MSNNGTFLASFALTFLLVKTKNIKIMLADKKRGVALFMVKKVILLSEQVKSKTKTNRTRFRALVAGYTCLLQILIGSSDCLRLW